MAQLSGLNVFGIGSQIGYAEAEPGDSEDLQAFIAAINAKKNPPQGTEDEFVADLDKNYNNLSFQNNVFVVAFPLRNAEWGFVDFDREFLGVYGKRAIKNNTGNYIKYVMHGMQEFALYGIPYITLLMLAIPLAALYSHRRHVLAVSALLMFAVHFSHCLLTAALQSIFFRYLMLSFYPYACAVILCFCSLIFATDLYSSLVNRLPGNIRNTVGRLIQTG